MSGANRTKKRTTKTLTANKLDKCTEIKLSVENEGCNLRYDSR